jgi:two-component sensor histidine kinase
MHEAFTESIRKRQVSVQEKLDSAIHNGKRATSLSTKANGTTLGIAFHELATNAVKYGAFSNAAGSILLAWTIAPTPEGDRLILRWQEKDGPPVTPPTRKGFGSRVIERGLANELEGTVKLDYRLDGVVCTINIPASDRRCR